MLIQRFKKVLPWVGLVFLVWLAAYVWAWFGRADCPGSKTLCTQEALRAWVADFVMFSWVYPYQTLIAGMLAGFAATMIILNSAIERRNRREDAREDRIAAVVESLASLQITLRSFAHGVSLGRAITPENPYIQRIEIDCSTYARDVRPLVHMIMYSITEVLAFAQQTENGVLSDARREHSMALLWCSIFVIERPEEYFATGKFQKRTNVLTAADIEGAGFQMLSENDLKQFEGWLNWQTN